MNRMHADYKRFRTALAFLATALILTGCGATVAKSTVSGKATYRGQPLTGGTVIFHPQNGHPISVGVNEAGQYAASLPPGDYRVAVNAAGIQVPEGWKEGDPSPPPPKLVLPPEYSQRAKSTLQLTVAPGGGPQTADFILK